MRARSRQGVALWLVALAAACGDDDHKAPAVHDAGSGGQGGGDASVAYMGATHGGTSPSGPEIEPEKGDNGPFEVSDACCDVTLSIPSHGDEASVRVVGDLPPLDGEGKAAEPPSEGTRKARPKPVPTETSESTPSGLTLLGCSQTMFSAGTARTPRAAISSRASKA